MKARRLAWGSCAASFVLTAVGLGFVAADGAAVRPQTIGSPGFETFFSVICLAFPVVGALIAARRPRNPIGWLFLLAGIGKGLDYALVGHATHALVVDPGSLPGGALAALIADAVWVPTLAGSIGLLFLLFPDGRLVSRRWLPVLLLIALGAAAFTVGTLLNPGPMYYFEEVENPLGVAAADALAGALVDGSGLAVIPLTLLAVASLAVRFRQSHGRERQQLKWLAYAAALLALSTPVQPLLGGAVISDVVFAMLVALLPVAVGIAILRHRLYDVDLVIRRTLVYGALTATLAATYLGLVLLVGLAVGESGFAVAASTLVVAALARPVLARIQALVDRRFYRRRYDAARTLESFGGRLRDELDLDALGADLSGVVRDTMQPAHVSLWLREPAR